MPTNKIFYGSNAAEPKPGAGVVRIGVDSDDDKLKFTTPSGTTKTVGNADIAEYVADGAILATKSHTAFLTKAGVGAYTLAAPATDGIQIDIVSATANAHVVTGTNLFWAGATGGPFNLLTFAAFPGAAASLVSRSGLWLVKSATAVTVGD